jgi:hypothetical protein
MDPLVAIRRSFYGLQADVADHSSIPADSPLVPGFVYSAVAHGYNGNSNTCVRAYQHDMWLSSQIEMINSISMTMEAIPMLVPEHTRILRSS